MRIFSDSEKPKSNREEIGQSFFFSWSGFFNGDNFLPRDSFTPRLSHSPSLSFSLSPFNCCVSYSPPFLHFFHSPLFVCYHSLFVACLLSSSSPLFLSLSLILCFSLPSFATLLLSLHLFSHLFCSASLLSQSISNTSSAKTFSNL